MRDSWVGGRRCHEKVEYRVSSQESSDKGCTLRAGRALDVTAPIPWSRHIAVSYSLCSQPGSVA